MKIYNIRLDKRTKVHYYSTHYTKEMEIIQENNSEEDESYLWELDDLASWLANYAKNYRIGIDQEAEQRIANNYSVEQIVKEYQDIIDGITLETEEIK